MISKFMLCDNPLLEEQGVFILHTQDPPFIMEALHSLYDEHERTMEDVYDFVIYPNPDGLIDNIQLIVREFYSLEESEVDEQMDKIRSIIKRAARWYIAYLKLEDGIVDKKFGNPKNN